MGRGGNCEMFRAVLLAWVVAIVDALMRTPMLFVDVCVLSPYLAAINSMPPWDTFVRVFSNQHPHKSCMAGMGSLENT